MKRIFLIALMALTAFSAQAETQFDYAEEVNSDLLKHEIEASTITVALERIDVPAPGSVSIHFKADLSAGEETTLNAIVTGHDPTKSLEKEPDVVRLAEEIKGQTGGHYGIFTMTVDLDNDTTGTDGWYQKDHSFPFPVTIIGGQTRVRAEQEGDQSEFYIAPDTITGVLTVDADTTSVLSVQQTVIDNAFIGAYITLDDSLGDPNDNENLGRIVGIDTVNDTITVETATSGTFLASSPTYVKMSGKMASLTLFESNVQMGFDRIGARTPLPTGTIIRMRYKKNGSATGLAGVIISYLY